MISNLPRTAENTSRDYLKGSHNNKCEDLKELIRILNTEVEEIEWPEDHAPKFHPKKATKHSWVAYDKRTKKYTGIDTPLIVPEVEIIKIDLGNNVLYYCYHPTEKAYIRVQPLKDFQAKFTVLANAAHMIRTRDVTVMTLLAFTTQTATSATKAIKNATKEAHTEEMLKPKIVNYRLYIDLIQKIIELITRIAEDQLSK